MTIKQASKSIIIGEVLVDWFTVTAWDDGTDSWHYWHTVALNNGVERKEEVVKIMQYEGYFHEVPDGTLFIGSGNQGNRSHNMVRASGNASNSLFGLMCARPVENGWARCTRLDIQMTLDEPEEWSQWRLFNRLKKAGLNVNYISSKTGHNARELATVYVGSRHSTRMIRIYQKEANKGQDKMLRFEVEFKSNRANQMAKEMNRDRTIACNYLLHEIQQIGDNELEALFGHELSNYDPKSERIRRVKAQGATAAWLIGRVLPALDRHINDHGNDDEVIVMFAKVIMSALDRR